MTRYRTVCDALRAEPRRWLVTGVAGFIGSALLEKLLELGQTVVGLDSFATGYQHNLDDVLAQSPDRARSFTFIEGDICDPAACRRACDGVDFVLHQAALGSVPRSIKEPLRSHAANVNGFLEVMFAARDARVKRVVYASSSSVYGDHPGLPKVEDRIGRQLSPYAITKRVDELYAGVIQDCYGLEIVGLRYFNVFGRRQDPEGAYAAVIPRWVHALLTGKRCEIFGDGSNSRDFCYVDNTVQANILAATAQDPSVTNQTYNVGCNGRTTLTELYTYIRDSLAELHPEVASVEPVYGGPRSGDVLHSQANIEKIQTALGYEYTHDIRTGLRETVRWFAERARAQRGDPRVTAPGPGGNGGGPGAPSGAPGVPSSPSGAPGDGAEQRARAALAAGEAPATGDVIAVLDELARVRAESEQRWQAITRLAPAAKAQRARAESGARSRARLADHLNALEQLADQAPEPLAESLRAWAAEARALLASADGSS